MNTRSLEKLGEKLFPLVEGFGKEVAHECYNQCLAVECGEGECAKAIRTKFNLKI